MVLYTGGECPVCSKMHDIGLVKNPSTGLLFFFCHNCGCCFLEPPVVNKLDEIVLPETYSPGGFVLPTEEDVVRAKGLGWDLEEMDEPISSYWEEVLADLVKTGRTESPYK